MNDAVLLVDLENIQRFDLGKVPPSTRIKIFVGQSQNKLPTTLVQQAQALGSRLEWVRIDGNGPNALDFHIACHLGEGICKFPKAEFVILSNDKGFDPLVRHLVARGFKCRRDGQASPAPAAKPPLPAHAQAVADLLKRSEKNKRPRKRTTLHNYLATHFNKKLTGEEVKKAVAEIKELINAGEAYQVVLSQCFSVPTNATPVSIYRAIRRLNPSPYMFLIRSGGRSVIGASPEMLVRVRGKNMEYRPIAGTRPRGTTPDDDARLAEDMRADRKEVAEHLMLVDLGRNDLGRVAEYGSVKVDSLMHVEKYSHVQHLVSFLSATSRDGLDRFDALASCFPAGTVSGAPKVRAIEIIERLEPTPRGIYAGTVGYIDYAGNLDTCIAIRALSLESGVAKVQAGAGIVADSVPESEYQETVNKARAMIKAIEMAEATEQ